MKMKSSLSHQMNESVNSFNRYHYHFFMMMFDDDDEEFILTSEISFFEKIDFLNSLSMSTERLHHI
jgi:hypothetical protein